MKICTFAATSRTFFPKAAGTTLTAVYLNVRDIASQLEIIMIQQIFYNGEKIMIPNSP